MSGMVESSWRERDQVDYANANGQITHATDDCRHDRASVPDVGNREGVRFARLSRISRVQSISRSFTISLLALGALTGCGGGGLGQMDLSSPSGAPDKGGLASALDAPLAVGGEVRPAIHHEVPGSAGLATHLLSPRRDIIEVRDGLVLGKAAGTAPVLVALDGDVVIDFIHVTVRAADRIEVHGIDPAGSDLGELTEGIDLVAGESMRLVPHAYAGADHLVGVATSTFTVEPPIALVLREGLPNRVRLVARQPGQANVTATMLGKTKTLRLKVLP
jgi:hypothetical protein